MDTDELTYGSYLRVPELLALQRPRSRPPHPEELHFIVVHQALELWMKLLQHDLGRIVGLLDADAFPPALALLGRVNHTLEHALDQMRSLHTLPPWDLQQFRSYLGTASGSQSVQFRELELRSGLREPAYLKALEVEYGGVLPGPLADRLAERSLADAHAAAAARLGIGDLASWADFYVDPGLSSTIVLDESDRTLSARQREILQMLADGMQTDAVADKLGLSTETVRTHTKRILAKLEASTRTQAVAIGIRHGLIE